MSPIYLPYISPTSPRGRRSHAWHADRTLTRTRTITRPRTRTRTRAQTRTPTRHAVGLVRGAAHLGAGDCGLRRARYRRHQLLPRGNQGTGRSLIKMNLDIGRSDRNSSTALFTDVIWRLTLFFVSSSLRLFARDPSRHPYLLICTTN